MQIERTYKTGQFAKLIGIDIKTLQRWDRTGKLIAYRTPTNRRFYTETQLKKFFK